MPLTGMYTCIPSLRASAGVLPARKALPLSFRSTKSNHLAGKSLFVVSVAPSAVLGLQTAHNSCFLEEIEEEVSASLKQERVLTPEGAAAPQNMERSARTQLPLLGALKIPWGLRGQKLPLFKALANSILS